MNTFIKSRIRNWENCYWGFSNTIQIKGQQQNKSWIIHFWTIWKIISLRLRLRLQFSFNTTKISNYLLMSTNKWYTKTLLKNKLNLRSNSLKMTKTTTERLSNVRSRRNPPTWLSLLVVLLFNQIRKGYNKTFKRRTNVFNKNWLIKMYRNKRLPK